MPQTRAQTGANTKGAKRRREDNNEEEYVESGRKGSTEADSLGNKGAKRRRKDSDEEYVDPSEVVRAKKDYLGKKKVKGGREDKKALPKRGKTQHSKAQGSKARKPRLPDATKVKFTTVTHYESLDQSAAKLVHDEAFRTRKFIETVPVFRCDFDLEELKKRNKKNPDERAKMQKIVDGMEKETGRTTSCIVVDKKGHVLIAYFSQRENENPDKKTKREDESKDVSEREEGDETKNEDEVGTEDAREDENEQTHLEAKPLKRKYQRKADAAAEKLTVEEHLAKRAKFFLAKAKDISEFYKEQAPRPGASTYRDGIPEKITKRAHQGTQDFAADRQPCLEERDVRHPAMDSSAFHTSASDNRVVQLPASKIAPRERAPKGTRIDTHLRGGVTKNTSVQDAPDEDEDPPGEVIQERCGVYHLVHCWHAQGTKANDEIGPSKHMTGTGAHVKAVAHYFKVTKEYALVVGKRFRGIFPDWHARYLKAFKAGRQLPLEDDPGPFIGRAVIWKVQVLVHLDGLDAGPVGTSPSGRFKGGGLLFPDFVKTTLRKALKFRYAPGDLCLSFAGALFHGVQEWEPLEVDEKDSLNNITPGRISTVFFFPEKSLTTLECRPTEWARNTAGGLLPSAAH